jgi:type IV pilus assembly protein PilQ
LSFAPSTSGSSTRTNISSTSGDLLLNLNNAVANFASVFNPQQLVAALNLNINNSNAKVITDPSITVQEGETGTVSLTEGVATKSVVTPAIRSEATGNITTPAIQTITVEDVGLALNIQVERIDDNGFINLSISPSISAPGELVVNEVSSDGIPVFVRSINKRVVNSGKIRLRDNQTLVLSGIIRDQDVESVSKVPLLGDLPIIGALFRSQITNNTRSEIVIVVTPRIIDDSQDATWGYTYQPGPETQKVLDSNQRKVQ